MTSPIASDTCRYYGLLLTGFERDKFRLDHVREWVFCSHEFSPLGLHVCRCRGCGSTCPGFTLPKEPTFEK